MKAKKVFDMIMEIIDESVGRNYEVYLITDDEGIINYWCWSFWHNRFLWIPSSDNIKKITNH